MVALNISVGVDIVVSRRISRRHIEVEMNVIATESIAGNHSILKKDRKMRQEKEK